MTGTTLRAETAQVIRLSDHRQQKPTLPAWAADIAYCCLYAECLKADHAAARAKINLEQKERGIRFWWEGPQDFRDRVNDITLQWELYRAVLTHLAALPALTRSEAQQKRATIGRQWLCTDRRSGDYYADLRAGCEADDHLFPNSLKLAKGVRNGN